MVPAPRVRTDTLPGRRVLFQDDRVRQCSLASRFFVHEPRARVESVRVSVSRRAVSARARGRRSDGRSRCNAMRRCGSLLCRSMRASRGMNRRRSASLARTIGPIAGVGERSIWLRLGCHSAGALQLANSIPLASAGDRRIRCDPAVVSRVERPSDANALCGPATSGSRQYGRRTGPVTMPPPHRINRPGLADHPATWYRADASRFVDRHAIVRAKGYRRLCQCHFGRSSMVTSDRVEVSRSRPSRA
jgi:hypothetical protein